MQAYFQETLRCIQAESRFFSNEIVPQSMLSLAVSQDDCYDCFPHCQIAIFTCLSQVWFSDGYSEISAVLAYKRHVCRNCSFVQMQGLSSGIGTFLGTCIRIPCEVLKQRLQTGRHPNVIAGIQAATRAEGVKGLFRGTSATLSREVPFYVLGIVFFEQLKKFAKGEPSTCLWCTAFQVLSHKTWLWLQI